jgi:hypothetical protein
MKNLTLVFLFLSFSIFSQNIGINTPNPTESLDVTGNINISGTLKAAGIDGNPGQVLMKNGNGSLIWGDISNFKKLKNYEFTIAGEIQHFTVPANVTKIRIQAWGGGGLGYSVSVNNTYFGAGGGGGGYIEGDLDVVGGTIIDLTVGNGANGLNVGTLSYILNPIDGSFFKEYPGENSIYEGAFNRIFSGSGGMFESNTTSYIGLSGEAGRPSIIRYDQISSTDFGQAIYDGNGGNAGNSVSTGGIGGYLLINTTTNSVMSQARGSIGKVPGGGSSARIANNGGNGRVIIYF